MGEPPCGLAHSFAPLQTSPGTLVIPSATGMDPRPGARKMSLRSSLRDSAFTIALLSVVSGARPVRGQEQGSLRQQYLAAQGAQRSSDVPGAVAAYTSFLVQAQTELEEAYLLGGDPKRSMQLLDNVLELSRTPDVLLQGARASLLSGDFDRAKALAVELISNRTQTKEELAEGHRIVGRVLLKAQQLKEARQEFEIATSLDPTFQNGYDLAVACLDLGDEACATKVFDEMQRSFGDKPELHVAAGKAYGNSDFQTHAITEFRRAIAEDPSSPGTHYLLAAVLLANGGDESARTDAEHELLAELRLSPHDAPTYTALGQIALIRGDYSKAEALLQKAIQYGPQLPEAYLYLGQVYFNTGRTDQAETALQNCIQRTSDPSRGRYQVQKAHYLLGRILSQRGKQDDARAELQLSRELADKALALDKSRLAGTNESAHPATVQVAIPDSIDNMTAATRPRDVQALQQAASLEAELRPALADAYNNLGVLTATRSQFREATAAFTHAAAWEPTLEGLDYNWGRAAFAHHAYAEAVGPLTRYVAAHAGDSGARSVLAISQYEVGNYKACVDALTPVEGKVLLTPQVEFMYAQALVKIGRLEEGASRLTALAKANPGIREIQNALAEVRSLQRSSPN